MQDHVLDELLTKVPGFRQAYMEDGLKFDEYEEYGPVRYFRDMFIGAWQNALKLIKERRAAQRLLSIRPPCELWTTNRHPPKARRRGSPAGICWWS